MDRKAICLGITLLVSGCFIVTGQQPATLAVFTPAQAEAGRTAYENSCGKCLPTLASRRKRDPIRTLETLCYPTAICLEVS